MSTHLTFNLHMKISLGIAGNEDCFGVPLLDDDETLHTLRHNCPNPNELKNVIVTFSSGFADTLTRQLQRYLTGELSVPTQRMFDKTENAPAHNMESERTLGMVDAHMRRAPNAQLNQISAKVKCVKNNTMEWLNSMPPGEQRKVIRSAIRQRHGVTQQLKERKARNIEIAKQRLYELELKKQTKKTKQMETKVAKFVKQGKNVTLSDLKNEFPTTSPEVAQLAVQICHDPESIIARECTHLWYDKVKCHMEVYIGNFFEYTGGRNKEFIVEYWLPECPEDSHRTPLSAKAIVSDLLLGDLLFH